MNVTEVQSQIKTKNLDNFYIFTGEEWEVQKIYINQISKVSNKQVKRIDSITDVFSTLRNKSFISQSYVYVARDDKEFMQNEKLYNLNLGDNIFILLITNVDKRTKFYKAFKDKICEFGHLKPEILKKYIQKEICLSDKNCEKLMEVCDFDYGRCLLEIDKIWQYVDGCVREYGKPCDVDINIVFESLLDDGTIYTPSKDAIFDLVDSILDGKPSFNLYQQCLDVGEATMVIIKVLYDNAKATLQVQSCESKDIGKSTGLNGWQIKNAMKHKGVYSNRELINIMNLCFECQKGIVTGMIEEEFAIPYIMVNV